MKHNKKILMIATTALFTVGCIGLIGAMKYQNIKTEASDIKETDVAKAGVDASSDCLEGETPYIADENNNLQLVTKDEYEYKGYTISFIQIKNKNTGVYVSDDEQTGDVGYKALFRKVIDCAEGNNWSQIKELKGKKGVIRAYVEWRRDEDKIVDGKFYGYLKRRFSMDFLSTDGNERNMAASFNFEPETGKYLSIYRKASGTKPGSDDRYEDGAVAKAYPEIAEKLKNRDEKKKLFAEYAQKAKKELENVWGIEIYGDFTEKRTGYDIGMVMLRGKTKSGEDTMTEYDMLGDHIVDFYYM